MGISHSEAYAAAGVDIEAGYQGVKMMNRYVQRTLTADVISDLGGFGGLFSLDLHGLEKPVLVSGTDGVGTKQRIAQLMDRSQHRRHRLRGDVRQRHHLLRGEAAVLP